MMETVNDAANSTERQKRMWGTNVAEAFFTIIDLQQQALQQQTHATDLATPEWLENFGCGPFEAQA